MYAIINDYEKCEIFIRELPADTDVETYKNDHAKIGTDTVNAVYDTLREAMLNARRDAVVSLWTYNPSRNTLLSSEN